MKIFFVSDIHGSVRCFRKLVNAGKFYGVDTLIMGGDLAGKQLVPIIARGGTSSARYQGAEFTFETDAEIAEFERRIGDRGGYALRTDPEFVGQLAADQELVEQTLRRLILERTEELVALAADRLTGSGIRLLIGLGNDDFAEMIPYLDRGPVSYAADGLLDDASVSRLAADPLPTSPNPFTIATLPAIITSVPRRMPSTSDSRQP